MIMCTYVFELPVCDLVRVVLDPVLAGAADG